METSRIIFTASFEELQQAVVDCMLLSWDEVEAGEYGFTGYDNTHKAISQADTETRDDIAQAILDRRADKLMARAA